MSQILYSHQKNIDINNWIVDISLLSERDKRYMVAAMIKMAVIVMGKTTCYSFGGLLYLQTSGAGIGLRGSASLAKGTMGLWDKAWAQIMHSWGIRVKLYMRYIDDLRIYVFPIKPGWSWGRTGWVFNPECNTTVSDIRKTCDEFCRTFNSIVDFLEFTSEGEIGDL